MTCNGIKKKNPITVELTPAQSLVVHIKRNCIPAHRCSSHEHLPSECSYCCMFCQCTGHPTQELRGYNPPPFYFPLTPPHLQNSKIKLKKNYQKNRKQRLWNRSNSSRLVMMTILLCYSLFIYMYVLLQKGQKYTWQQHHEGKDQEKLGGLHLE